MSINYANRGDLFEGLVIWEEEKYRKLQGTFPVIALSFANVKEATFTHVKSKIFQLLTNLYAQHDFLRHKNILTDKDREYWDRVSVNMSEGDASLALYQLSEYLYRYYHKKVMILLDEYDTPMQEAYVHGYWKELMSLIRSLFLASGYLKALNFEEYMTEFGEWVQEYELALTNFEVKVMFQNMIRTWFGTVK